MELVKANVNIWIKIISVILGVLFFTLGEIALNDIENKIYKIKSYQELLSEIQTTEEKNTVLKYSDSVKKLENNLDQYEYQINSLETDISSKKQTLDQLLENQRVNPDNETKNQITTYQKQFLDLQNKKDFIKTKLIDEEFQLNNLKRDKEVFEKTIEDKYKSKLETIQSDNEKKQQIKVIVTQSVVILLLFIIGSLLLVKFRKTDLAAPVLGFNGAIYVIIIQAIYIHSPFKLHYYVFITIGIVVCLVAIIWLIRNIASISKKQSANLIRKNLSLGKCPRCNSDISLKEVTKANYKGQKLKTFIIIALIIGALIGNGSGFMMFFDNISDIGSKEITFTLLMLLLPWILVYGFINFINPFQSKKLPDPDYFNNKTCPVCGLVHIVKCDACGKERHNLLPYCNNCGKQKNVEEV